MKACATSQFTLQRRVFRDIVEGRTDVQVGENLYYIKHLSALDQVEIDNIKSKYFEEAVKRGIPKKEENLKDIISKCDELDVVRNGLWAIS